MAILLIYKPSHLLFTNHNKHINFYAAHILYFHNKTRAVSNTQLICQPIQ